MRTETWVLSNLCIFVLEIHELQVSNDGLAACAAQEVFNVFVLNWWKKKTCILYRYISICPQKSLNNWKFVTCICQWKIYGRFQMVQLNLPKKELAWLFGQLISNVTFWSVKTCKSLGRLSTTMEFFAWAHITGTWSASFYITSIVLCLKLQTGFVGVSKLSQCILPSVSLCWDLSWWAMSLDLFFFARSTCWPPCSWW